MKHPDPHDESDPLWELLGRARPAPPPSAAFTRSVVREAERLGGPARSSVVRPWVAGWRGHAALAAAAALVAACAIVATRDARGPGTGDRVAGAPAAAPGPGAALAAPGREARAEEGEITVEEFAAELAELAHLNELMGVAEPGELADDELAELLF